MRPIDKKINEDIKEGNIPEPIEDLPSEWEKEDREIGGSKPDLGEVEEDPSELWENGSLGKAERLNAESDLDNGGGGTGCSRTDRYLAPL
jgi:hypothetical protein